MRRFLQSTTRHAPLLLAISRRVLGSPEDADDVLVEVFLELWLRADRFDGNRGSPITYLTTLTRSRSLDRRRSLASRKPPKTDGAAPPAEAVADPDAVDPQASLSLIEQSSLVRTALSSLHPSQREALEQAYFEGLSHTEIAQVLNKPLGTVKTYIRQGLIRLRQIMRTSK